MPQRLQTCTRQSTFDMEGGVDCRLSVVESKSGSILSLAVTPSVTIAVAVAVTVAIGVSCRWDRASLSAASIERAEFLKSVHRSGFLSGDGLIPAAIAATATTTPTAP
ncbi:hypothetical protein GGS21DRAFT_490810 [Xylaria nigripes]|nr:hypothetical protein GGS21DRAFT_490810 [Xylaria nigripes]